VHVAHIYTDTCSYADYSAPAKGILTHRRVRRSIVYPGPDETADW